MKSRKSKRNTSTSYRTCNKRDCGSENYRCKIGSKRLYPYGSLINIIILITHYPFLLTLLWIFTLIGQSHEQSGGFMHGFHARPPPSHPHAFAIPMSHPPPPPSFGMRMDPYHSHYQGRGRYHIGLMYPGSGSSYSLGPSIVRERRIALPSMNTVKETLGALGTLARRFLKPSSPESTVDQEAESKTSDLSINHTPSHMNSSISQNILKVRPEDDPELTEALYTLSRNVLGPNMTHTLAPIVRGASQASRFLPLPPLIYRDGRIILGSSSNATKDGGSVKDVVCTTPGGRTGKCLDISGCPSLLLDLQKLRKSLCFKALFVPGVCCPDNPEMENSITVNLPAGSSSSLSTSTTTRRPPAFNLPALPVSVGPDDNIPLSREDICGRPETPSFRIVGGEKSTPGNWPWMAAIFLHGPKGTEFWCGGTLISKKYVLTAAHCTKDQKQKAFSPRQFTVRLGDYDLTRTDDIASPESYRVLKIKGHESFNGVGFYNDLAVLELDREVTYNRYISPICLPEGRSKQNSFVGTYPTVIGWGTNKYGGREHTALQQVKLPVWTNSECDRAYFQPITEIFLCAGYPQGGRDACQGDSGGPLMLEIDGRWTQIGIVSFGNRCAEPGYPGVYTRLTQFMDWIKKNAN